MDTVIDTIVVGGGQAGLSVSWHLKQAGREHLVLDRGRVGDTWRNRWDSFCLVSPNKLCRLPGFPYDGADPDGFMLRDMIVNYIERYAASFDPPYRAGVEVQRISAVSGSGRFELTTSDGVLTARNLVITAGTQGIFENCLGVTDLGSDLVGGQSRQVRMSYGVRSEGEATTQHLLHLLPAQHGAIFEAWEPAYGLRWVTGAKPGEDRSGHPVLLQHRKGFGIHALIAVIEGEREGVVREWAPLVYMLDGLRKAERLVPVFMQ